MIFVNLLLTEHDIDCIAAYVREHLRDKANAATATAAVYAGMKGTAATATGTASSSSSIFEDVNRGGPLPPFSGGGGVGCSDSIGGGGGGQQQGGHQIQCTTQYFGASDDSGGSSDDEDEEDDDELLAAVAAVTVPRGFASGGEVSVVTDVSATGHSTAAGVQQGQDT